MASKKLGSTFLGSNISVESCVYLECICLNQTSANQIPNALVGDGFCNDETNNAECQYDGGDCCGICVNLEYCLECICFDVIIGNEVPNALVGDGFCDDETNNFDCNYDGGDCCGNVRTNRCSDCSCHLTR